MSTCLRESSTLLSGQRWPQSSVLQTDLVVLPGLKPRNCRPLLPLPRHSQSPQRGHPLLLMAFTLIIAKLWVCDLSQTGQSGSPPGIGWCHYRSLLQTSEVVCDRGKGRGDEDPGHGRSRRNVVKVNVRSLGKAFQSSQISKPSGPWASATTLSPESFTPQTSSHPP
ncbi:hypothetical protein JEQ12_013861 [Ovis aries]|uniref:Uncharacterized protein n=1 Tax=Ovis aries TaxID=9940 RepID=A0A836D7A3_SHEEP|nr:hypothetical protein JEQ12_013861 [Ovis aries]